MISLWPYCTVGECKSAFTQALYFSKTLRYSKILYLSNPNCCYFYSIFYVTLTHVVKGYTLHKNNIKYNAVWASSNVHSSLIALKTL